MLSGIGDLRPEAQRVGVGAGDSEACIAQAVAEGIAHLLPVEGFKPPIAHIDILPVFVGLGIPEAACAGIGLIAIGNGVRQMAAGGHLAAEQVGGSIAAFHASLPENHHSAEGIVLHKAQVDEGADV